MHNNTSIRHPELRKKPVNPSPRKPDWIRVKAPISPVYEKTKQLISNLGLTTVCEEAACPNIGECWAQKHATVMILGAICTRACAFCNVRTGKPGPVNPLEPMNVANMALKADMRHMVITSVDRDDLPDGGASQFAKCVHLVHSMSPDTTVEILTPDFLNKEGALEISLSARPEVFNHNLETVPRLYPTIRPGARYFHSLRLLERTKELSPGIFTKSGIMVGLGERRHEVLQVMDDLISARVDFLTIGQYLQPTLRHASIDRFVTPDEFSEYAELATAKGFLNVSATPLTRSSYHADKGFKILLQARQNKLASPRTG